MSDAQMARFIEDKRADQARYSARHRAHVRAHVDEAAECGSVVAEFPTTLEAAHAARHHTIKVMSGAPNLVRGGSHSGNVSARELADAGLVDILSSDYVPSSLLHAAFLMAADPDGDDAAKLPDAVAAVSDTPARAIGLDDRGAIAPGLRADLIRVTRTPALPIIRAVWRTGERVA